MHPNQNIIHLYNLTKVFQQKGKIEYEYMTKYFQFYNNCFKQPSLEKQMQQKKFKQAQGTKAPNENIYPLSHTIVSEPVFNDESVIFDTKAIEQQIDKNGSDPFTQTPLSKKDLQPNKPLREVIHKFVQGRSKKQQLQYMNVYQVAKIQEKQLQKIGQRANLPQKEVQKLLMQLKIAKNQLSIQRSQKQFAINNCEIQKQKATIDKKRLNDFEMQNNIFKERYQMLQQKIKKREQQNQVLNKQNLESRQLQKSYCQKIDELQKMLKGCRCVKQKQQKLVARARRIKLTPDKESRGLNENEWRLENTNMNVCIKNTDGWSNCWMCSSSLPSNGEFVFAIEFIRTTVIWIGVMEVQKKGEKIGDTYKHSVYLYPSNQWINRPNDEQTQEQRISCSCSQLLPKRPFQIECHVNRSQNTIAWHYAGQQQAKTTMPRAWKTNKKQLCAIVYLLNKGDSVEMM